MSQEAVWEGTKIGAKCCCARQVLHSSVAPDAVQQAVWKGIEMGGEMLLC